MASHFIFYILSEMTVILCPSCSFTSTSTFWRYHLQQKWYMCEFFHSQIHLVQYYWKLIHWKHHLIHFWVTTNNKQNLFGEYCDKAEKNLQLLKVGAMFQVFLTNFSFFWWKSFFLVPFPVYFLTTNRNEISCLERNQS